MSEQVPPELDEELELLDEELELLEDELELLELDELELDELEVEELEDEELELELLELELELFPPLATQPRMVACGFSPSPWKPNSTDPPG